MAQKQRVLTDALYASDAGEDGLDWIAAPEATDPARVVELREVLRERAREEASRKRRRAQAPGSDLRRRYTPQQRRQVLATFAAGGTIRAAATAAGVRYRAAHGWIASAPARLAVRARAGGTSRRGAWRDASPLLQRAGPGAGGRARRAGRLGALRRPGRGRHVANRPEVARTSRMTATTQPDSRPSSSPGCSRSRPARTSPSWRSSCAPPATARTRSGCAGPSRPATPSAIGGCGQPAASPTACSARPAATAARPSAPRARSATARTPTT